LSARDANLPERSPAWCGATLANGFGAADSDLNAVFPPPKDFP